MKKIILCLCFISFLSIGFSQIKGKSGLKTFEGFYTFYYEEATDRIYLKIDRLNEDFLYINSLASGVGSNDIGLDRGKLGQKRLVRFERAGNKILLVQPNLRYRANTNNELERKSIEQAFAKSVLYGFKIIEETNGEFFVDLTPFLLEDSNGIVQVLKRRKEGSFKVDLGKSAMALDRTKAFPENVEFESLLTFKGQPTGSQLRTVTPTASLVSVIQHHSFIKLPDDNYQPRKFDTRSGAISMSFKDYAAPIQDDMTQRYVIRHRLEKIDPTAEMSSAKEPIVYYLDPGTPEPVRSALLEGASWWNEAFEAIGFKNAFQVKLLPEDADPMDCRYNVIQWVHRSTRGWSYGASVTDPRTGEIIKGHVSLGSLRIRQDFLIAQALMKDPFSDGDDNYQPMLEMALARIRQLSAHEVGHTLGFTHNFAASTNNRASVMDYPHPTITVKNGKIVFSDAYDTGIGEWDKVTVEYSYSDFKNGENESFELESILKKAQTDGLRFISDYDARAQGGAHAFAHLWDNGTSASLELKNVLEVRKIAMSQFSEDNITSSQPYTVLEDVFVPLYFYHRYQVEAAVKVIGGLDYSYATKGDGQNVVSPIDVKLQQQTLDQVLKSCSAENLAIPRSLLTLFPPRAYGYYKSRESFKGKNGVAFDPVSAASTASDLTLRLLLHPERMNRVVLQNSIDNKQLSLKALFGQLIASSFNQIYEDSYLQTINRQYQNNVLKHLMNLAVSEKASFEVNALAYSALEDIAKKWLSELDDPYAKQQLRLINQFKEDPEDFKLMSSPKIPDGSPIGMDVCNYNPN
ncbi:zinc-dependent metalloprotease [Winogradskyella aurantiaca]|uniref:zinc-dependent metalloprotease n=1 Tax=Winogradskyella aurantiaca TaxID=2219558 RepID=UPI000E1D595C|nr:zinc-dependent metalloprotease [Winogradskyella aurantiaca]